MIPAVIEEIASRVDGIGPGAWSRSGCSSRSAQTELGLCGGRDARRASSRPASRSAYGRRCGRTASRSTRSSWFRRASCLSDERQAATGGGRRAAAQGALQLRRAALHPTTVTNVNVNVDVGTTWS